MKKSSIQPMRKSQVSQRINRCEKESSVTKKCVIVVSSVSHTIFYDDDD